MQQYADIERLFNALLAQDLNAFSARIAQEQRRIQGLRDLHPRGAHRRNILGSSKFSQKLRDFGDQAAANAQTCGLARAPGHRQNLSSRADPQPIWPGRPTLCRARLPKLPRLDDGRLDTDLLFGRVGSPQG
jgi:hypothetical protein